MTNLFYGYDMRDWWSKSSGLQYQELLAKHVEKFGNPPSILINKVDSVSVPTEAHAKVDPYVLPNSILLEISEE